MDLISHFFDLLFRAKERLLAPQCSSLISAFFYHYTTCGFLNSVMQRVYKFTNVTSM
jgi:hypothetical protein